MLVGPRSKVSAAILGELVWWVHYEPYRAQMAQAARMEDTEMHDPKTRAIKQKLKEAKMSPNRVSPRPPSFTKKLG